MQIARKRFIVGLFPERAKSAAVERIPVPELPDWKFQDEFATPGLGEQSCLGRHRPKDEGALCEEEIHRLKRKLGELTMDLDILREVAKRRPTTPGTSEE